MVDDYAHALQKTKYVLYTCIPPHVKFTELGFSRGGNLGNIF